jgi:hypothetical protein
MLHVRCGSDILDKLREAGLPGEMLWYADPVAQGPVPLTADVEELHRIRAGFIADASGVAAEDVLQDLRAAEAALGRAGEHEEVVLWFEHDLFDQAILIRLLDHFSRHPHPRLSLVTLDRHPEVPRFIGLGNLNAGQLGALFPRRVPVTAAMLDVGRRAWAAWREPAPLDLERLADEDGTAALPYLVPAIRRHLAELPAVGDGLAETERLALEALAEGRHTARSLFVRYQERDAVPWLGDSMFYYVLRGLAEGARPLLRAAGEWPTGANPAVNPELELTGTGASVLAGRVDRVRACGVDGWVGGVRVEGRDVAWRWDRSARRVRRR